MIENNVGICVRLLLFLHKNKYFAAVKQSGNAWFCIFGCFKLNQSVARVLVKSGGIAWFLRAVGA